MDMPLTTKTKTTNDKVELIPLSAYVDDFKARMEINNREVKEFVKDLRKLGVEVRRLFDKAVEASTPMIKAAQDKIASFNKE